MKAHPYLNFKGNCREAFEFYAETFGGEIVVLMVTGDTPMRDHMPPELHDSIVHAQVRIGDSIVMGSDAPPDRYKEPTTYVSVMVDSIEDAERIFAGLMVGGTEQMELQETFFAHRFGMLADRFGTQWMIVSQKTP